LCWDVKRNGASNSISIEYFYGMFWVNISDAVDE